ncbi:MAG: hypothetical protein Q7W16_08115, partial [Coriobacteriia bacterium]|nr:hypothetical protein [Coriobacteriia bacterium]
MSDCPAPGGANTDRRPSPDPALRRSPVAVDPPDAVQSDTLATPPHYAREPRLHMSPDNTPAARVPRARILWIALGAA